MTEKLSNISSPYQRKIPKSIETLEVILASRENFAKFVIKYKGRQRQFTMTREYYDRKSKKLNYKTTRDVLVEIFGAADLLLEMSNGSPLPKRRRKNPYWEKLDTLLTKDLDYIVSIAGKIKKSLENLFGDEYDAYRILSIYEKRSIKSIYGVEPDIQINYKQEGVFYDKERLTPIMYHHTTLPYTFEPFEGLDIEFLNYIKRVDRTFIRIDTPFMSLFYTNSGSLIGMSNSTKHYIVTLDNIEPIDRPVILLQAYSRRQNFIMFKDSVLNVEEGKHYNSVSSREGWGCITSSTKEHVLNSRTYYNRFSKFYKKGEPYIDEFGRVIG